MHNTGRKERLRKVYKFLILVCLYILSTIIVGLIFCLCNNEFFSNPFGVGVVIGLVVNWFIISIIIKFISWIEYGDFDIIEEKFWDNYWDVNQNDDKSIIDKKDSLWQKDYNEALKKL
jgi:hypothetical protein